MREGVGQAKGGLQGRAERKARERPSGSGGIQRKGFLFYDTMDWMATYIAVRKYGLS